MNIQADPTLRTFFLQEALKARGFYAGKLDNTEGPKTHEALRAAALFVISESRPAAPPVSGLDDRTLRNIATLDPKAQSVFIQLAKIGKSVAAKHGCTYTMISGNRTHAEQNALYAYPWDRKDNDGDGKTDEPDEKVTNARGGYSNHNFGIAGDFGVFAGGKYLDTANPLLAAQIHKEVAEVAEEAGLPIDWGGHWKFQDLPHFEIAVRLSMPLKREKFAVKGSLLD